MAIRTRLGGEVRIVGTRSGADGSIWVDVEYPDGERRERALCDLRADGGVDEIRNVIGEAHMLNGEIDYDAESEGVLA